MPKRTCMIDGCEKPAVSRGWCNAHYIRWYRFGDPLWVHQAPTTADRFWAKVDKTSSCWLWAGATERNGYGRFNVTKKNQIPAHRWTYEQVNGPVPEGLELDHLCRVRNCVNPDHLEAVTHRENMRRSMSITGIRARQTHCIRGHEFDEKNTYIIPNDRGRACRACAAEAERARRRRLAVGQSAEAVR
jgi:hypothetical protein